MLGHFFTTASKNQMQRRTQKFVLGADLVFKVALVAKVNQFVIIYKENKRWRIGLGLGNVIKFQPMSLPALGWILGYGFMDQAVDLAGGDAAYALFLHLQGQGQHFV